MRKYYHINLVDLFDHKIISSVETDEYDTASDQGVFGVMVQDKRFSLNETIKKSKQSRYLICKRETDCDNFICSKQYVELPPVQIKRIAILGFNEYGTYEDNLELIKENDEKILVPFTLYALSENVDCLYECEKDEKCAIAFNVNSNFGTKVGWYEYVFQIDGNIKGIVFPDNPETHILAVTVMV